MPPTELRSSKDSLGILGLHSLYPKPVGHMRNPLTFSFPMLEKVVEGVSPLDLATSTISEQVVERVINAAKELEACHVGAIAGSCGYLLPLQDQISAQLTVPFISTSLLLLPTLRMLHGHAATMGILAASSAYYTHFDWTTLGVAPERILVKGLPLDGFLWKTIRGNVEVSFDVDAIRTEVLNIAEELRGSCDAIVIECTDISMFAHEIAISLNIPVYDINAAIEFLHTVACRPV